MIHRGTYDGTIYYNPANKFCIISVKTAEKDVPQEARSTRRRKDHLIRFVATGYELPRTDAVELELDGEWKKGKYGMQLQVEQWHEIVPQTKSGVEGYLASGLIKGIGPALAKQIVSRFGVETLDILQNRPERLLEIKGITENKLEAIKTSYAESRMLQDLMTLLSPFKITPKTAQKIYQFFGPASVDILKKSPFELCQISGFGFLRVDAIVQKNGGDLRAPTGTMAGRPLRASGQLLQGGFMRKTSFEYHIHGYRYAPESFHIYKGLPGQEKTELPLSDEQRYQMGYLYLTQGIKSAVDYVKHIERERERKCRLYMTYGFMLKENPRSYVYCADLRCRENDPLAVRLHTLRAFREHLAQSGGRIEQSVECELDGRYRPIHTRKNYVTADFDRPIVVWLNIR